MRILHFGDQDAPLLQPCPANAQQLAESARRLSAGTACQHDSSKRIARECLKKAREVGLRDGEFALTAIVHQFRIGVNSVRHDAFRYEKAEHISLPAAEHQDGGLGGASLCRLRDSLRVDLV